jgi:hypothetical protein
MIHIIHHYQTSQMAALSFGHRFSAAMAASFVQSPHAFIVGGVALMIAIQLLSLGFMALQNKRYFEEIFHLGSTIYRTIK